MIFIPEGTWRPISARSIRKRNTAAEGIAGRLLTMAVEDLKSKGIAPVYLLTDHTGFYERYGWQFLCMVQENGETGLSRMYIHR